MAKADGIFASESACSFIRSITKDIHINIYIYIYIYILLGLTKRKRGLKTVRFFFFFGGGGNAIWIVINRKAIVLLFKILFVYLFIT